MTYFCLSSGKSRAATLSLLHLLRSFLAIGANERAPTSQESLCSVLAVFRSRLQAGPVFRCLHSKMQVTAGHLHKCLDRLREQF